MKSRIVALLTSVLVLAGCTDVPAAETSDGDAQRSPDASVSGLSEPSEETSTPAVPQESESSAPSESADEPDAAADPPAEKPRKNRLVAVDKDDRGKDVEALQKRLNKLGFAAGPVDGVYGPRTTAAVEAFQMLAELEQTGRADARTAAALEDFQTDTAILRAGDKGREVKQLQRRLADGPFDPGKVDGEYGGNTVQAVWALEKLAGVPVDGDWGPLDEYALEQLERGDVGEPEKRHKKRWVEIDLSEQLMKVYDPDSSTPVLVSHASSGNGVAWSNGEHSGSSITPLGDFVISRRIAGWRESSLDIGRLYNPLYFNGGIALHGALAVPPYPASHGCIRLPMHIADYLPGELPNGTAVHVLS